MAASYKLPKVTQYVKNVGKSIAFASIDAVKDSAPGIRDFNEINGDIFKEAYASVKNIRQTARSIDRSIRQSNLYRALDTGMKNFIEDAKSGNFYHDRMKEDSSYAMSTLGIDDDLDIDFSFDEETPSATKSLSDSFNDAIGAAATSHSTAVAESTNLIVSSGRLNNKLMMVKMDQMTAQINSGLGTVYTGISATNKFLQGPMTAHLENSKKYYENSLKIMQEQQMMMKEMLEMQRNLYKAQSTSRGSSRLDESMGYDGSPDLRGYFKNIKKNISDYTDSMGLGMLDMGGGNPFMALAASPAQMLMQAIMKGAMPKDFKKSIRNLDKSITSMFSQFIARMNYAKDRDDGSLMSFLGKIFGIEIEKKNSINTANYKKGAVPFDGITRQAIIETIPGYLARIESALTGADERLYDFKNGSWKTGKQIKKEFDNEKTRAIANANYGLYSDTKDLVSTVSQRSKSQGKNLKKKIDAIARQIYEDGGVFHTTKGPDGSPAWMYYGCDSKKEFDSIVKQISRNTMKEMASNNMRAIQNRTNSLTDNELSGGVYRHLFNGQISNDKSKNNTNYKGGSGLLAISKDGDGHNVFWYLREILNGISRRNNGRKGRRNTNPRPNGPTSSSGGARSRESESSSSDESEGDSSTDDDEDIDWDAIENEQNEKNQSSSKKKKLGDWLGEKLGDTKVGRAIANFIGGAESALAKPFEWATKLFNKADENIFKLMFGDNDLKDDEGNKITSIFQFMVDKVKTTFNKLTEWLKTKFNSFKDKYLKPIFEKYVKPVTDQVKNYAKAGWNRTKQAFGNVFGGVFHRGGSPEDTINNGGVVDAADIQQSAGGRIVTKRGLTMISPGEIIIPASFDKNEQRKMLSLEKKEKNKIMNAIGYNASGTMGYEDFMNQFKQFMGNNKDKFTKAGAGGIIGGVGGLLTGVNPLLGAMIGAGGSLLADNSKFKKMIFGEEVTDENGNVTYKKGLLSKKTGDFLKKAAPDVGDFGIVGGIAGLLTPFGPLGGAAIGAGIGLLKNSEGFKKFLYGDEETGKDGLMKKETMDKIKKKMSEAAPKMAVGAVAGALLGPFGILGNAVVGSGIGLLTTTDAFHKFVFGDPDNPDKRSLVGAIQTGLIEPAKEKIHEFGEKFKEFAQKNILEPMKNFWEPFQQAIKNTIISVGEKITDHMNDMFEKTIGIPLHDFLQEKIFKPINKILFGILKAPIAVGKAMIAAPMRALGGIGNSIRMGQIQRGTATDMSAAERLRFRENHGIRSALGQLTGKDKTLEQDTLLAGLGKDGNLDQLEAIATSARAAYGSEQELQKSLGRVRTASGRAISAFFNQKRDGHNLYDAVGGYPNVKKLTKLAEDGNLDDAIQMIDSMNLDDADKKKLKKIVNDASAETKSASDALDALRNGGKAQMEEQLSNLLGHKVKGRSNLRKVYKNAEAELKARRASMAKSEDETEADKLTRVIDTFNEANKSRTEEILKQLIAIRDAILGTSEEDKTKSDSDKQKDIEKEATISHENKENANKSTIVSPAIKNIASGGTITDADGNTYSADEDSKSYKEAQKKKDEKDKISKENLEENKESTSILKKMHDKLFGDKDKKSDKSKAGAIGGVVGSLLGGAGKFLKFMGVGGKVALALTGVSLFGHATEWFKTAVWPKLKTMLFGTTNEDGTKTSGVLGGIGTKLHDIFYGEDGKGGVLSKAGKWISEKITKVKEWFESKGGFSGILTSAAQKMVVGWGYAISNVVAPLTTILLKALPGLLLGLGKGILQGIKMAIFNKDLKRENATMTIDASAATQSIDGIMSTTESMSSSTSDDGGFWGPIKSAFGGFKNSMSKDSTVSFDLSSIASYSDSSVNNEKAGGLAGALGATRRTNEIEYDDDGNIITNYTQFNTSDSAASRLAHSTGRGFVNGLAGLEGGIGNALSKVGAKAVGKGLGTKIVTGGTTAAAKATGNILKGGNNAGLFVTESMSKGAAAKAAETAAKAGTDVAADVATNAADNAADVVTKAVEAGAEADKGVIASKIGKVFEKIGQSKLGGWLLKACSKNTTQAAIDKAMKNIGEKLGEKVMGSLAGTALKKVANAIAGFSPLALVLMVGDFISGYDQAYTILGVAKGGDYTVGIGQKCLCGLLNLINNRITFGLIPTATIVDIIVEYLFPVFGIDTESLNKARDEAANMLDEWNKAHPDETYDNLEDYNNKDKWWFKAKNAIGEKASAAWSGIKEAAGNAWSNIKEGASNAWDATKTAVGNAWEGTKNFFSNGVSTVSTAVKNTFDNAKSMGQFVKDVIGEMKQAWKDPDYHWNIEDHLSEDDPLSGSKRMLYQTIKFPLTAIAGISNVMDKVSEAISGFAGNVKDGITDAWFRIKNVGKGQYTIFSGDYWTTGSGNEDEENPLSKISKVTSTVLKVVAAPVSMVGYLGSKVIGVFKTMIAGAKEGILDAQSDVNAVKSGQYTIFSGDYWHSDNTDEDNPLSKLGSVFGVLSRIMYAPSAMMGYVGTKIKAAFTTMINGAKEGILDAQSDVDAVKSGQYTIFSSDYWHSDAEEDTDNPISKLGSVFGVLSRIMYAPSAMLGYAGTKIKAAFTTMIDGAKEGILDSQSDVEAVKSGKYTIFSKDYWHSDSEDEDGNPLSKLGSIFGTVSRIMYAPSAMIGYLGTKVKSFFTNMVNSVKDITEETDKVVERAEKGEISVFSSEYWKMSDENGNPLGLLGTVVSFITRLTSAPVAIFKSIFNKIKERFDSIKGWFKRLFGEDAEEVDYTDSSESSGSGRGRYGRGHAYQGNPMYKNMKYGDSTIAASGCAPVAATNIINRFEDMNGGGMTVGKAADYAEKHGMTVPGGGTNISYFNSFLNSNGIATSNTSNKGRIMDAVNNGDQVVMLGQDKFNGPNAPFGTNPHFITAVGMNGNQMLVEDPDLPDGLVSYDKDKVLNSMDTSVIASNKMGQARKRIARGRRNLIARLKAGMGRLYYGLGGQMGAQNIISVAESQIGTKEIPANSNNVKYNTAYYGHAVSGDSYPWCCAFVWWVFNQAGAAELFYGGEKTAYCPTLMSYYQSHGQSISKNGDPKPGDIVFFNWNGGSTAQHVGIVKSVNGNSVITIEGNTSASSNDNGGAVMQRERSRSCIIGFARPNYPYTYDSSKVVDMSQYKDSTDYASIAANGGTDSSSSNESTSNTIFSQLSNLGTSVLKSVYGEDAYNAIFGESNSDNEDNTDALSGNISNVNLSGNNDAEKIWNWLTKTKGLSSKAAAGIMGCWQAESGNRSARLEGDYLKSFPGFDAATKNSTALNNWTQSLFSMYANSGIGINKNGYKGADGNYYPGFGLAQWTGPRGYNLMQYGKNNGGDWRKLETQLSFAENENGKFSTLQSKLDGVSSPAQAAKITLDNYEMYNGFSDSNPKALNTRVGYANSIYQQMAGSGRADHGAGRATKYGGSATRALNSRTMYAGGAGSETTNGTAVYHGSSTGSASVDYATFLQTIVSVLMSISDNTALLNKILSILSENFNINIDKSDIDAASSKTKAQTEAALNQLVQRSSGNNVNVSKLLNNKDTGYILEAMKAIATE